MTYTSNKAAWLCIFAGLLAYLFLPWYAIQDTSWYQSLPQTWQQGDAANGLLQALLHTLHPHTRLSVSSGLTLATSTTRRYCMKATRRASAP